MGRVWSGARGELRFVKIDVESRVREAIEDCAGISFQYEIFKAIRFAGQGRRRWLLRFRGRGE